MNMFMILVEPSCGKGDICSCHNITLVYVSVCIIHSGRSNVMVTWAQQVPSSTDGKITLTLSQTTNFRLFQTERVCRRQF